MMALANYTDLQATIKNHLHRADLDSLIPDFISLGEVRLNRALRLLQMEEVASLTASTSTRYVALPTGFMEAINLTLYQDSYPTVLSPIAADAIDSMISPSVGRPTYYRITDQIEFDRVSDSAYSMTLRYLKRLNLASDSTNWLMTNHPDCYLYSALVAASPYIRDQEMLGTWGNLLGEAINAANEQDSRTRSDVLLPIDSGLQAGSSFNIWTGQ